jgi:hypothetical protein
MPPPFAALAVDTHKTQLSLFGIFLFLPRLLDSSELLFLGAPLGLKLKKNKII